MKPKLSLGTQIGRFRVEEQIGQGGMGVVYRCFDPVLKRPIALKLLASHLGHDPKALARFQREATLVASLKHAHIAIVYDFGQHEGQPYIALEWIEGRTLKEVLETEGQLALERCLNLFDQLASALDYAHQRGVIHRDLKPANIIIGPDELATIVDFGIAWLEAEPSLTTTGAVVGTPLYMSPEQIQGKTVDGRSDLYSLAVIFYQILASEPPFHSDTPAALFQQLLYAPAPPISEHNPSLPIAVEQAFSKALEKDPDKRFPTGASMSQALRGLAELTEPQPSQPIELYAPYAPQEVPWRRWVVVGVLALLVLTVSALLWLNLSRIEEFSSSRSEPTSTQTVEIALSNSVEEEEVDEEVDEEWEEDEFWSMIEGNRYQTRFFDGPFLPFEPEPRWIYESELDERVGLVAVEGQLIVAEGIEIFALDPESGEPIQEPTLLSADVSATPSIYIDDEIGLLVVPTENGELYSFDLVDGRLRWHTRADELADSRVAGLMIDNDRFVYAATDKGWVYRLELFEKEEKWSLDLSEKDQFIQPPTATNVALFLSSESEAVVGIDLATKKQAWRAKTIGTPLTPPVVAEEWGIVMVGTNEGWVQAFSMILGEEVWNREVGSEIVGLALDWEHVYITTADGRLVVLEAQNGEQIWQAALGGEPTSAPITAWGEMVMVSTEEGEIRFFNIEQEKEDRERRLKVDAAIRGSPLPAGKWLFVQTSEGIYGFTAKEEGK